MSYANGTSVSVAKTRGEIEELVGRSGASKFFSGAEDGAIRHARGEGHCQRVREQRPAAADARGWSVNAFPDCICDPNPFQCRKCRCVGCGCFVERPILFSAPMIRAILAGTKTQTRRIVRDPPKGLTPGHIWYSPDGKRGGVKFCKHSRSVELCTVGAQNVVSPYGMPGDGLWVKETWRPQRDNQCERITYAADGHVAFENDVPRRWRRPKAAKTGNVTPLFMPRWASRITLEVTGVRVERLQDISEDDAKAEGCSGYDPEPVAEGGTVFYRKGISTAPNPRAHFHVLWESINGAGSWAANPFVWRVEFKRVTP